MLAYLTCIKVEPNADRSVCKNWLIQSFYCCKNSSGIKLKAFSRGAIAPVDPWSWRLWLSTYNSPGLFSTCSLVFFFLCGLVVSTVELVWQCCHHFFSVCPSQFHFFLAGPAQARGHFFHNSITLRLFVGYFVWPLYVLTILRKHLLMKQIGHLPNICSYL